MRAAAPLAVAALLAAQAQAQPSPGVDSSAARAVASGDDECEAADGACAASWLQLRGEKVVRSAAQADVEPTPVAALEGPGASAEDDAADDSCPRDTGGTCSLFNCGESRGPVDCVHRRCKCKPGFCNDLGVCRSRVERRNRNLNDQRQCVADTGGSCRWTKCYDFRGPTECNAQRCTCKPGFCSVGGVCHKQMGSFEAKVAPVTQSHPDFPGAQAHVKTALVMSGGGARSMVISQGVLRALEGLDLMKGVDAISSVSGGAWAGSIYMFADMPAEEMLGGATKPEDLSMDELKKTPAAMGKAATAHTAKISASLWWNGIASHLLWTYTIGEAILKPFGLDSKNSYMAPDEATVARIRKENPQLKTETFLVPVAGRPKTFVMSGTILAPTGYKADAQNVVSLQMSPDYSGSPFFPDNGPVDYSSQSGRNNQELKGQPIGGGVVESFAWGGSAPKNDEADAEAMAKGATVKMTAPLEPLTLGKAVGVSSAGPASALTQVGPHGTLNVAGLIPRASIWSIAKNKVGKLLGFSDTSTYNLGDGGNLDNSGVLAMLQRKAQRVIWLINTGVELPKTSDVCGMKVLKDEVADNMDSQITAIFGYIHKSSLGEFLTQNQAFALDDLPKVLCSLAKLHESGKPAVTLETLEVQKNNWWGIAGGNKVDVLFVYNSPCQNFIDKLPLETRDELDRGRWGLFKFFPHYLPVVQNLWDATALTNEQVNLLAAHAEYMTRNTRDLFGRAVGV